MQSSKKVLGISTIREQYLKMGYIEFRNKICYVYSINYTDSNKLYFTFDELIKFSDLYNICHAFKYLYYD